MLDFGLFIQFTETSVEFSVGPFFVNLAIPAPPASVPARQPTPQQMSLRRAPAWIACAHFPEQEKNMRPSGRSPDQMRSVTLETGFSAYAEGSCLAKFGDTHVLCNATVEERVPPWMRNSGRGWVTAEYGMLPRSTHERTDREAARGKQSGRTQEIQRLIGRSLRAVVNLEALGERQVRLDCDVIQADGGTRTASITGAYVALKLAMAGLMRSGALSVDPVQGSIAAISCGIYQGTPVLDLDYAEDSNAEADANFVLTGTGGIVEIQGTAEADPFSEEAFLQLMELAKKGVGELTTFQNMALAD
jgi:ribonuclease PH